MRLVLRSRMNTSNAPFSSRPVKAIWGLSARGLKRGVWLYLPWKVTRLAPPPDDDITKIWGEPWRFDTNAICEPSGEYDGELSLAGLCVSRPCTRPSSGLILYIFEVSSWGGGSALDRPC